MIRRPPRSTLDRSSAASDVYKRQGEFISADDGAEVLRLANEDDFVFAEVNKLGKFVSCLLYTSPSPRDRTRSRMPSSA